MKPVLVLTTFFLLLLTACSQEGPGGTATVSGQITHNGQAVPNAIVYIKYDADQLPGTAPSEYDASTVANAQEGLYDFYDLKKGDYFVYTAGFDSLTNDSVFGGVAVNARKNRVLVADIAATE